MVKSNQTKTFYHGTSDSLPIRTHLLPPVATNTKREDFRSKDIDKVFFTDSLVSAEKYAKKASKKYGGKPVVYKVRPIGQVIQTAPTEYVAEHAIVIKTIRL